MSLIHEALKKAEEQRRLGQPPDFTSPFSRPRERQPLLPFLLVAIVIAGGAGWWVLRTPATPNATKTADSVSAPNMSTTAPARPPNLQGNTGADTLERTAARSSSAERQPIAPPPMQPPGALPAPNPGVQHAGPATMPGTAKLASGESATSPPDARAAQGREKVAAQDAAPPQAKPDPADLKQAMDNAAKVAVSTTPLNSATKPEGPATVNKVPMPDTGPTKPGMTASKPGAANASGNSEVAMSGAKKPELPDTEPVTGPTLNPPPATPTAAAPNDNLPLFWQLDYPTRKDLPQLAMSMHVYAADPGKRFVVINGDHKAEGDPIGADLFVREIRSDGVVMEFRGKRFLVPRGGS